MPQLRSVVGHAVHVYGVALPDVDQLEKIVGQSGAAITEVPEASSEDYLAPAKVLHYITGAVCSVWDLLQRAIVRRPVDVVGGFARVGALGAEPGCATVRPRQFIPTPVGNTAPA